jgi:hypothetical protein
MVCVDASRKAANRLMTERERLAHDAVQYRRALLLMEDRMKIESSVMRRIPTH